MPKNHYLYGILHLKSQNQKQPYRKTSKSQTTMKNVAKSMLAAVVSAFAVPLQARLEVSSDGAIKVGDPGKTRT